jgi:outer membrane protein assembly factor BamB
MRTRCFGFLLIVLMPTAARLPTPSAWADGPWTTYRGNPQRSGNTDGKPGPAMPKVLWALKSTDHFIASPVPAGDKLIVSAIGGLNVPSVFALPLDGKGKVAQLWLRTTPYLTMPTVSSPALLGERLVLGDGMHQSNGAFLHCWQLADGEPIWQLRLPGELVHLEGSPTVANQRVFIGGGAAGVLCVDPERLMLEGKAMTQAEISKLLAARWQAMLQRYEQEKKADPDFAIPPSKDQLPRPSPTIVWQQGKDRWHVDAPVNVQGELVLVGSAFLDKEKVGDRALFALKATDGKQVWRQPLKYNPWGGPSVANGIVVVAGSTIAYDTKALKGAKGNISAFDLATGTPKWSKDLPGGVLGSVAIADGLVVAAATDGKVRGFDLATGDRRFVYEAKTPCFAPPAVVGKVAYVGDLLGVVHAIDTTTGAAVWTLDLGKDPATAAPGMIYGGPVVHGGRIYVATCNLEGPNAGKGTVIACIGSR